MLALFVLASFVVAAALVMSALDVIRPPERVVSALFVVFSLLVLLVAAWTFALLPAAGSSEEGARNAMAGAKRGAGTRGGKSNGRGERAIGGQRRLTAMAARP